MASAIATAEEEGREQRARHETNDKGQHDEPDAEVQVEAEVSGTRPDQLLETLKVALLGNSALQRRAGRARAPEALVHHVVSSVRQLPTKLLQNRLQERARGHERAARRVGRGYQASFHRGPNKRTLSLLGHVETARAYKTVN